MFQLIIQNLESRSGSLHIISHSVLLITNPPNPPLSTTYTNFHDSNTFSLLNTYLHQSHRPPQQCIKSCYPLPSSRPVGLSALPLLDRFRPHLNPRQHLPTSTKPLSPSPLLSPRPSFPDATTRHVHMDQAQPRPYKHQW
jgi:hypothetical protein